MAATFESRQRAAINGASAQNGQRVVCLYGGNVPHSYFATRPSPKPQIGTVMLYGQRIPHRFIAKA